MRALLATITIELVLVHITVTGGRQEIATILHICNLFATTTRLHWVRRAPLRSQQELLQSPGNRAFGPTSGRASALSSTR